MIPNDLGTEVEDKEVVLRFAGLKLLYVEPILVTALWAAFILDFLVFRLRGLLEVVDIAKRSERLIY
jgi:hypothetical protein